MDIDECWAITRPSSAVSNLEDWHVFSTARASEPPRVKAAYDGYLESYHFAALHKNTIFKETMSNLMAVDASVRISACVFAKHSITELRDRAEEDWDPPEHIGPVYTIFPCLSLAGGWRDQAMISQLFPGPTADRSRTVQTIITANRWRPTNSARRPRPSPTSCSRVVRDEDYATGFAITKGLKSGANEEFLFGRNEPSLHHFHRWVDRLVEQ